MGKPVRLSFMKRGRLSDCLARRLVLTVAIAILSIAWSLAGPEGAVAAGVQFDESLFKKIEANLMCTDGCGMWLPSCDNATARKMREEIQEKLIEGVGEREIYAYMISIYGEEIMAAPPPEKRFNLLAWVTPFVAILAGGLVIYLALDRWVFARRMSTTQEGDSGEVDQIDLSAYEDILQSELKKYL